MYNLDVRYKGEFKFHCTDVIFTEVPKVGERVLVDTQVIGNTVKRFVLEIMKVEEKEMLCEFIEFFPTR